MDLMAFEIQLVVYIIDLGSNNKFSKLQGTGELLRKIVDTEKDKLYLLIYLSVTLVLYLLIYLSITLVLIVPITTIIVERAFLGKNFVKNRQYNWMGETNCIHRKRYFW